MSDRPDMNDPQILAALNEILASAPWQEPAVKRNALCLFKFMWQRDFPSLNQLVKALPSEELNRSVFAVTALACTWFDTYAAAAGCTDRDAAEAFLDRLILDASGGV